LNLGIRVVSESKFLGCRQVVRHWILIPAYPGSNPGTPAKFNARSHRSGKVKHGLMPG
jgi:hypothetical protein